MSWLQRTKASIKAHCTTLAAWELPKRESSVAPPGVWTNEDMDPVPSHLQTWTSVTFLLYWCSDLISAGSWSQISSFVAIGLTWWESMLAVLLGSFLISILIACNGIIGARLHTPFAVSARGAYGWNLSKFAVISRMVIAWFWFSINTYQGGTGVKLMLIAIWPSFRHFKNHLPESSGTDSSSMLCFFLFWLMQAPFTLINPRKLRPLFLLKAIAVPITAVAMMGWSIHAAGDQAGAVLKASPTLTGLPAWYAFMTAVTSCMGTWTTMATSISDFSRYSKKTTSAALQVVFFPFMFFTCALFGAISSNMMLAVKGEVLWQPFDIIDTWEGSKGGRAAAFFASFAWAIGNLGTNITANSISSANDFCTLFPRWINIFRGQLFAIFIGTWAFAPWKVLGSAGSFISFMGAYSIVLGPLAAVLSADYYLVKKGRYSVPALYDPNGIYRYNSMGINWRALAALVVSIGPNMPGMINALDSSIHIGKARYIYAVATIFGITVATLTHWGLSTLFPHHETLIEDAIYAQDVLDGHTESLQTTNTKAERAEGVSVEEKASLEGSV